MIAYWKPSVLPCHFRYYRILAALATLMLVDLFINPGLTQGRPHPLNPPLLLRRGGEIKRGALAPLRHPKSWGS